MDARAALTTLATHELAFTDPGSIFLDGKNVLSLVIELDTRLLGGATLVGVVAETLTRGTLNVRIERVGRPEVKNMMLAPKEFDPVNRDLEIRDLYNMEDAFHLGDDLPRRVPRASERQPRLLGRPGRQGWTGRPTRRQPPVDRPGPRRLPRRRRHEALPRARLVPRDRARGRPRSPAPDLRRTDLERRRDGHDLHPARQRRTRPDDPGRRRLRHPPGQRPRSPTWRRPTRTRPSPPSTTSDGRHRTPCPRRPILTWSSTTSRPERCSSVRRRTSART